MIHVSVKEKSQNICRKEKKKLNKYIYLAVVSNNQFGCLINGISKEWNCAVMAAISKLTSSKSKSDLSSGYPFFFIFNENLLE